MDEQWRAIKRFPGYSVSDHGRIRADRTGRILQQSQTGYGLVQVGMMQNGIQKHRSVPLLVAKAFLPVPFEAFDTPINKDWDRWNNHVDNLEWRPRWFAVKYNRQIREPYDFPITDPLEDIRTGEVSENSTECSKRYGLLEEDVVLSIVNRTFVWPTYQEFRVLEE